MDTHPGEHNDQTGPIAGRLRSPQAQSQKPSVPVFPVPFLRPGPVTFLTLVLRLKTSSLWPGGRSRDLWLMLLIWLPTGRLSRQLHGLPHMRLPQGPGSGVLCLRMRLGHARLRTSLFLLRVRRWGPLRPTLSELLPADSLTGLVAIVVGAN